MRTPIGQQRAVHCDLFCRVVDNFGDIGCTWRLARQLQAEQRWSIRLIIDDLATFSRLVPEIASDLAMQSAHEIVVEHWTDRTIDFHHANVVIEAFSCGLPESYLQQMAHAPTAPLWINLDYLSAENWVETCHRQPSPHPRFALTRHFFFPGFTANTGGLSREANLLTEQQRFVDSGQAQQRFLESIGVPPITDLLVFALCYPTPAWQYLTDAWAQGPMPVTCLVAPGAVADQTFANGASAVTRGALTLRRIPFLPQSQFDQLLWSADFVIVRGEDSFVRAQWAAKPFIWHIYPQDDEAHLTKLAAFSARYTTTMDAQLAQAWTALSVAWNTANDANAIEAGWQKLLTMLPRLTQSALNWRQQLLAQQSLSTNLASFVEEKLQSQAFLGARHP